MSGRPRTRLAGRLVEAMILSLHDDGPAYVDELLYRIGYGLNQPLSHIEQAAVRMALHDVQRFGPVALDPGDGRLKYHRPGWPSERAVTDRIDPIVRRERERAAEAPLYVPLAWQTRGTAVP